MSDKETAVESMSHQVASCVHLMLANRRVTVAGLKAKLSALPTRELVEMSVIDDLLAARNPHAIQASLLADIGLMLGFDWDFRIAKIIDIASTDEEAAA